MTEHGFIFLPVSFQLDALNFHHGNIIQEREAKENGA